MQFKEINKDNPLILEFVVEYKCDEIPLNPKKIWKAIDKALDPIKKHFINKGMQDKHRFTVYMKQERRHNATSN